MKFPSAHYDRITGKERSPRSAPPPPSSDMVAAHSPLPWAAQPSAGHESHGQTLIYSEATAKDVALVYSDEKDAALIVRTVNLHDALVEALEELLAVHDLDAHRTRKVMPCDTPLAQAAITKARAALAKAKGVQS